MKIELRDLVIQFPGMQKPLLQVDERIVPEGTRLLVRGPSGTGKTSLLHIVAGLMDPHRGTATVGGTPLADLSESQRCTWRRQTLGLVFQRLNLLGHLTALENVLLGSPGKGISRERALRCLVQLGVGDVGNQFSYNLSLGEQQRVAVARVIARSPSLILADEPTSSLDAKNADLVISALLESVGEKGTLVVATHDDRIASHFQEVWSFREGRIE